MARKSIDGKKRLRLMLAARAKVGKLARPAFQRRLAADKKWFERQAKQVQKELDAGTLTKRDAARSLRLIAKASRETERIASSTKVVVKQIRTALDREIRLLRKEG